MSCTENENGPFVVFFLPAAVACLTILLARRWANNQVNTGSTTGVSRRRKIIKDPLVKRPPLPTVSCKMSLQPNKKNVLLGKKGLILADDDANSNGRRSRTRPNPNSTNPSLNEMKMLDGPVPPKHIPFPNIPQDGEMLFEIMSFTFTIVATGLQFLNLYRTIWWIPDSGYTQAMHFDLIDPHLVAFIVTILSRRFLLMVTLAVMKPFSDPKSWNQLANATRMFILGVILGALAWCTYFIAFKYPLLKLFYLCYPAVIYFLLFGFHSHPFLHLSNSDSPILHCCSHDPAQVRSEVQAFREDFNMRVKKILFNSVIGAYYSSFIPCCFAQSFIYYDAMLTSQQVVFVWLCLMLRHACQTLSAQYCDVLHRAALHLGCWSVESNNLCISPDFPEWIETRVYGRGSRTLSGGRVYISRGAVTAAVPGDNGHTRFYAVFRNPSNLLCLLGSLQIALVILMVCLLISTMMWYGILSICLLLFINYYTMFKLFRDYLVACKVYRAEACIQDKNIMVSNAPT